METKRRKLLCLILAAVLVAAAVIALIVLLPQRKAEVLPMPTEIPVADTPAAETPEPTPLPTEEPPAITPPAQTGSAASDSDIVLRPIVPASESDLSADQG